MAKTVATVTVLASLLFPTRAWADDLVPGPVAAPTHEFVLGFKDLRDQLGPTVMGWPLEPERQVADADAVQLTTRGLAVWRKGELPTFTNGAETFTLKPASVSVDRSDGLPVGGALGRRLLCIERYESNHSATALNRSSGARGWLQWLPSTARQWGVIVGDRVSEWNAAARIAALGERFFVSQWVPLQRGLC